MAAFTRTQPALEDTSFSRQSVQQEKEKNQWWKQP